MTAVYITSLSEKAGKTLIGAGLGKTWLNSGKKIGYIRLLPAGEIKNDGEADSDAVFIHRLFGLKESPEALLATPSSLKEVYSQTARDKDAVIIEGLHLASSGSLIEDLDARVVVIHEYPSAISMSWPEYKKLGKRLMGIILNKVPRSKLASTREQALSQLTSAGGIPLMGVIPEDRLLSALTVAGLAELLQGKILYNGEKSRELVENIMLGALTFDSGEEYFKLKNNKAVILKSERPDMQLAALQTSLRCMVISGAMAPIPAVVQQAKIKKVPLITSRENVPDLVAALEKAAAGRRFNQEQKMPALMESFKQNINLKSCDLVLAPFIKNNG